MKSELIPLQGYPGYQEHQTCSEPHCNGEYRIKELIWGNSKTRRVSLKCDDCGDIYVCSKEWKMFRRSFKVKL